MKVFLTLLILTIVNSSVWLIYQYSVGRKSLFKYGLKAFVFWLVGSIIVAVIALWFVFAAIGGHTPQSFETASKVFLAIAVVWSLSIFPFLMIAGLRFSRDFPVKGSESSSPD